MQNSLSVTLCTGFSFLDPSFDPIMNVPPGIVAMSDGHVPLGAVGGGGVAGCC
jgi:hypothetical protein